MNNKQTNKPEVIYWRANISVTVVQKERPEAKDKI